MEADSNPRRSRLSGVRQQGRQVVSNFDPTKTELRLADPRVAYNLRRFNHMVNASLGLEKQQANMVLSNVRPSPAILVRPPSVLLGPGRGARYESPPRMELESHGSDDGLEDKFIVDWDSDNDPLHPMNWSWARKSVQLALLTGVLFVGYIHTNNFRPLCTPGDYTDDKLQILGYDNPLDRSSRTYERIPQRQPNPSCSCSFHLRARLGIDSTVSSKPVLPLLPSGVFSFSSFPCSVPSSPLFLVLFFSFLPYSFPSHICTKLISYSVLGPISQVIGRRWIYHISNVVFLTTTVGSVASPNVAVLILLRFLAGCASSAPNTVGTGTLADLIPLQSRGKAQSLATLIPLLGFAAGPMIGSPLVARFDWRAALYLTGGLVRNNHICA
jgi:hypothetical protein